MTKINHEKDDSTEKKCTRCGDDGFILSIGRISKRNTTTAWDDGIIETRTRCCGPDKTKHISKAEEPNGN